MPCQGASAPKLRVCPPRCPPNFRPIYYEIWHYLHFICSEILHTYLILLRETTAGLGKILAILGRFWNLLYDMTSHRITISDRFKAGSQGNSCTTKDIQNEILLTMADNG